ncbi:MAG: response regulator transcription factor [Clostridiales bacterium]|jgi:DNA-binding response OmpR family regulator|nr:response regulator transcription factor [Clostridiales bacterium]
MNDKMILCVEDNPRVQMFNRPLLEAKGFTVRLAATLAEAKEAISKETPSLIILDIHLPDGNGLDFLRELRKTSTVPVIALTNDKEEQDIVTGLSGGCDDYVTKPHTFPVLYARIEALLRRAGGFPDIIEKGRFSFDVTAVMASLDGTDLQLSPKEFALLFTFVQNEERFMSAEYLYEKVWKTPIVGDSNALKSAIGRLREKISGGGFCIAWSRGEGYIFERE